MQENEERVEFPKQEQRKKEQVEDGEVVIETVTAKTLLGNRKRGRKAINKNKSNLFISYILPLKS